MRLAMFVVSMLMVATPLMGAAARPAVIAAPRATAAFASDLESGSAFAGFPSYSWSRRGANRVSSSAVTFSFPSPHPDISNLAFSPNGTVFFLNAGNEIDSIDTSGRYNAISVPGAGFEQDSRQSAIIYKSGYLWTISRYGVIRVAPDGTQRRLFQLGLHGATATIYELVTGSDGAVYVLASYAAMGSTTYKLIRIDDRGSISSIVLPFYAVNAVVAGPNDDFYLYCTSLQPDVIAHVSFGGLLHTVPVGYSNSGNYSLVISHGALYFLFSVSGNFSLRRLNADDSITSFPLPNPFPSFSNPDNLTVDHGQSIWFSLYYSDLPYDLYQFNVATGHFNGPHIPAVSTLSNGAVFVGPDNNIWYAVGSFNSITGLSYYARS